MAKYIHYDYNQYSMGVINYLDQLQAGTFAHAVHYLLDNRLDLSCFDATFKNDNNGRPAYEPAIWLKIILFAYSKGITSSREIAECCRTPIIFKALAGDSTLPFTTLAHFIRGYPESVEALFEQVLLTCDEQGLLGNELVASDGCKLSSNAPKTWSGTHQELSDQCAKLKRLIRHLEHQRLEQQESRLEEQGKRLQQSIETFNKAVDKIDNFLKNTDPRRGHGKQKKEVKSNITDNENAKMTTSKGTVQGYNGVAAIDKKHQIVIDAQIFGEGQEHYTLQPVLKAIKAHFQHLGKSDTIYTTGIIVPADTGFANEANMPYGHKQNINGYIPDNQFRSRDPKFNSQHDKYKCPARAKARSVKRIPAKTFQFDPVKLAGECPAGQRLSFRSTRKDKHGNLKAFFEGRLSQCRHCELKTKCMKNPTSADHRKDNGRQVSFIITKNRKSNYTDWMKHRIDSDQGQPIHSHSMSVVEPVFGNIMANKGLKCFSPRGKIKVNAYWQWFCLIHNIEKLTNYGKLAA